MAAYLTGMVLLSWLASSAVTAAALTALRRYPTQRPAVSSAHHLGQIVIALMLLWLVTHIGTGALGQDWTPEMRATACARALSFGLMIIVLQTVYGGLQLLTRNPALEKLPASLARGRAG